MSIFNQLQTSLQLRPCVQGLERILDDLGVGLKLQRPKLLRGRDEGKTESVLAQQGLQAVCLHNPQHPIIKLGIRGSGKAFVCPVRQLSKFQG